MDERTEKMLETLKSTAAAAGSFAVNAAWLIGNGAKKLTDAARTQLKIADLRAEINAQMRALGELVYATHKGDPTDSDVLLAHMEKLDALKAKLAALEADKAASDAPQSKPDAEGDESAEV